MFLLQGCREENRYIENTKILLPHQDGIAKNITLKEFTSETNISYHQMKNAFLSINKGLNSSKISLLDFDIDTTFIKKLVYQNNKKSFSLRAYKNGENPNLKLYNIVYHKEYDSWKADIFQYTYTKEWLDKYNTNALTTFSGRIQHIGSEKNINLRTSETYECSSQIEYLCYCANHTTSECNGCSQGFRNVLTLNCVATGSGGSGGGFGGSDITPPPNLGNPPYNDPQTGGGNLEGTEFWPNLMSFDDPMYEKYILISDLKNVIWTKLQNYPELYKKFENFHVLTNGVNLYNLSELANYASSNYQFTDWAIDFWSNNTEQFQSWFIEGNQDFNKDLLKMILENNYKIPSYTISDYPGKNNGMPFNWWNDETYLNTNMSLGFNSVDLTLEEIKMCALFPAAALTISTNKNLALDTAANSFPGQGAHNNKADAFRHAFFNALNIRDVYSQPSTLGMFTFAKDIVRMFGIAHESEVPANLNLEKVMDLYNNEQGIEVCSTCNPLTNPTNLVKGYVMSLLENGKLVYLKPIDYSGYTTDPTFWDTPNIPIPSDGHHGITSLTKIVPSNQ